MKEGKGSVIGPGFLFATSFLETVKTYGWLWEPRLVLKYFTKRKDFKGILGYAPLGIKMFRKGKIPLKPPLGGGGVKRIFKKVEERGEI